MDKKKALKAFILVDSVVVFFVFAWLIYRFTIGNSPLTGETSHDFGAVRGGFGGELELTHTFELTNRLDEVIEIVDVRSSCGCLATGLEAGPIAAGATIELPVTLTISRPGTSKDATVTLLMQDRGAKILRVSGEWVGE